MRILTVDDDPKESEVLKKLLKRRFDAEVFQASTMREARTIMAANNLDCVVLDLQLPDSGIDQTIEAIRRFQYPVFVYSGFDDPTLRERVLNSGAEDFILKATGNASIIERIAHMQYKRRPDPMLTRAAYKARHDEPARLMRAEWKGRLPAMATALVAVLTFAVGLIMGGWNKAHDAGAKAESDRAHFETLDKAVLAIQKTNENQETWLRDLDKKANDSSKETTAIRDQMKQGNDYIIDWLKRIEDKLPEQQRHTRR